jgi:fructose-1,6-bisphosphatase/inositol monophosphatase family enzyme
MKIELIVNASRKAANLLIRDFNEISYLKNSTLKIQQFLQKSRLRTEEILVSELQKYFPEHAIVKYDQNIILEKNASYIVFDALEGERNMQNMVPFFAISILVVTYKKEQTSYLALLNFPCLDKICYTATGYDIFIEDYSTAHRKKGFIAENNDLVALNCLDEGLLQLLKDEHIALNAIRAVGSNAYSLFLLASSGAKKCILKRGDWLHEKIAKLIVEAGGGYCYEAADHIIYGSKKATGKKILRFAVQE